MGTPLSDKKCKIAVLPGAFDPVHRGHIQIAHDAMRQLNLDKVYFLVEPYPRHKQGVKSLEHRIQMCELALQSQPNLGTLVIGKSHAPLHVILERMALRFIEDEVVCIFAKQRFTRLVQWPRIVRLPESLQFAIAVHDSADKANALLHIQTIEKTKQVHIPYSFFHTPASGETSQMIRAQLRKSEDPAVLDSEVQKYIKRHKLYSSPRSA